jgi:hypothetical protein
MTAARYRQEDAASRTGYLYEIASLLWPEPAEVALGGAQRRPSSLGPDQYLILPHVRHPRLIVPGAARAAAAAVTGFNASRSRRAGLVSRPLSAALRAGAGPLLFSDRLLIRHPGDTLQSHLSTLLGQELLLALQLSPARANRKPVAQLIDGSGTVVGYAKIGVNELTRSLIRHEAAALETLGRAATSAVTVPGIQHFGRWRDMEILLLRPLPAWHRAPARSTARLLDAAMREVAGICGITHSPLASSGFWTRIRADLSQIGPRGEPFLRIVGQLGERHGNAVLAFGSWHGDWTRTNVAPHGNSVLAWDWERFGTGVPVGFDALHYDLQSSVTVRRRTPEQAVHRTVADAERLLAPFGIGKAGHRGHLSTLTTALYLTELAARYLRDRQDEAGARMGDLERWMLPGLAAAAGSLK